MRLVVFDVDGTLVDSQHLICASMDRGFAGVGLEVPHRERILSCVGLSLDQAVAELAPDADGTARRRIASGYRSAYRYGQMAHTAPLYLGALECLDRLAARPDMLLAVATGMSRRGLNATIAEQGLEGRFVSLQTADDHASKPDPAMLLAALSETGVDAANALMIGDSGADMTMAQSARVAGFGVGWGYETAGALRAAGAVHVAPDFSALTAAIEEWAA
ncbi:HAD-IA family hydrolase [Paracoccus salsus]|uniref:HAD-IA family hydrolase n=1 Tax=Paracoccus salsus TaxID=2911061 RepID=UPI001F24D4F0|nr:HAD-IA family hydrolase [Paracoccus salsus]MCF3972350.1 HAD-IA family hydrolase [Paracoccus salsus]